MTDAHVPNGRAADTPSSLLLRVKAEDQAAWERLVSLYTPLVYYWCRQFRLQAADAADVGQEVFQAVAGSVARFRRERPGDSFRAWLRTITHSKACDFLRRRREQPVGGSDAMTQLYQVPDAPEADGAETSNETRLLYQRAVELVRSVYEEKTWEAFRAVVVDGQPPAAVASELGISTNAVYLAKARILKRLREEFAEVIED